MRLRRTHLVVAVIGRGPGAALQQRPPQRAAQQPNVQAHRLHTRPAKEHYRLNIVAGAAAGTDSTSVGELISTTASHVLSG